jgi:hypothetical protein
VSQHASIIASANGHDGQVLSKVAVVPQDAMVTTSPRGHARLIVTMCFGTSAGRTAVFELAPAQIIQVSFTPTAYIAYIYIYIAWQLLSTHCRNMY